MARGGFWWDLENQVWYELGVHSCPNQLLKESLLILQRNPIESAESEVQSSRYLDNSRVREEDAPTPLDNTRRSVAR